MPTPDDALLERMRAGDHGAWAEFVDRHRRRMFAVAYRMTGNAGDAEDLVQESFLAFSKALPSFRGEGAPAAYLRRTVVRASLRIPKRKAVPVDPSGLEGPPIRNDSDPELLAEVKSAVLTLPPQQRAVFVLRHYEGQGVSEIAETLELAEGTVKAHLHQALTALRERLRSSL